MTIPDTVAISQHALCEGGLMQVGVLAWFGGNATVQWVPPDGPYMAQLREEGWLMAPDPEPDDDAPEPANDPVDERQEAIERARRDSVAVPSENDTEETP